MGVGIVKFLHLFITVALIIAVNGATSTRPKLPTSVFTTSADTSVVLRKVQGGVPCAANIIRSVMYPPEYAKRSVVVIVPTTALPMRIPLAKSSLPDKAGLWR